MAKLTVDQYLTTAAARLSHLTLTFAITFFASVGTMFAILAYGSSAGLAAKFALATIVITITAYGLLAAKSAFDDLKAMLNDAVDDFSGSSFGAHLKQIQWPLFTVTSAILTIAIGVAQLWAIVAA
jgi:predicted DNA repair protein MutK